MLAGLSFLNPHSMSSLTKTNATFFLPNLRRNRSMASRKYCGLNSRFGWVWERMRMNRQTQKKLPISHLNLHI